MITLLLASTALAAPIVNGSPEEGFPSVVALGAQFGNQTFSACTGTLITPRIVLTAAHCGGDIDIETLILLGRAFVGPDVNNVEHVLEFEDAIIHPDYLPLGGRGPNTPPENDVSLLILAEEAPVEPTWINTQELVEDEVIGTTMKAVGFGITARRKCRPGRRNSGSSWRSRPGTGAR